MRSLGRELGHVRERLAARARGTSLFSSRDRINPLRDADTVFTLSQRYRSNLKHFNCRASILNLEIRDFV